MTNIKTWNKLFSEYFSGLCNILYIYFVTHIDKIEVLKFYLFQKNLFMLQTNLP